MNDQQRNAVRAIARAVVSATIEGGQMGAPGGVMYAALMAQGCSYQQFISLMGSLQNLGLIEKSGECYLPTDAGRRFAAVA